MNAEFTPDYFLALFEVPSTADYEAVYRDLRSATSLPMIWDAPGDTAEYITQLFIGENDSHSSIAITFSCWGNLCFVATGDEPVIEIESLKQTLNLHGWTIVPRDCAEIILYPPKETVHDRFFNYV